MRRVAPGVYAVLSGYARSVYGVGLEGLSLDEVLALVDKAFGARADRIRRIIEMYASSGSGGAPFLGLRGAEGGFQLL